MFSKTNSQKQVSQPVDPQKRAPPRPAAAPSILGRDLIVTGDIVTDGDIQIDGRHEGNITANMITIGEQGVISGDIKAKSVQIRGKVSGVINASIVELSETANVQADIIQDKLIIANGAFFDGKCSRRKQAPSANTLSSSSSSVGAGSKASPPSLNPSQAPVMNNGGNKRTVKQV